MGENNPEISLINGVKINLFKSQSAELANNKETKVVSKLDTAAIAKSISKSSISAQLICAKNKNPIRRQKKAKVKIISVVHIPKSIENKIRNQKRNRYIPIILKKPQQPKFKENNKQIVANLAESILASSITNSCTEKSSAKKEVLKTSEQLDQPADIQEPSKSNALMIRKELGILVPNCGQMESGNLGQVIPYDITRQMQNYFNKSNIQTHQFTNNMNEPSSLQLVNVCKEAQFYCSMPSNPIQGTLSSNCIFETNIPNENESNHLQDAFIRNENSNVILEIGNKSEVETLNAEKKNMQPKSIKINRFVSILKCNQPNGATNFQEKSATEMDSKSEAEAESEVEAALLTMEMNSSSESGTSGTLSFETSTTSRESEESLITTGGEFSLENYLSADEMDSFETVSEATFEAGPSTSKIKEHLHSDNCNLKTSFVPDPDEVNAPRDESGMKGKGHSSELVTVASDDIPYNAEIEIDSNNNFDDDDDDENDDVDQGQNVSKKNDGKMKKGSGNLFFDKLKSNVNADADDSSKRKLFLEREDVEFCKEAQRKVKGIRRYGYRGLCAIGKFNRILKLIPDESPATVHALMVACQNRMTPVLNHLRFIQRTRQALLAQEKQSTSVSLTDSSASTSSSIIETPRMQQQSEEIQAKEQVSLKSTRKKKISYNIDLSDNPDDSDEDYFPGKDLTPKKKKTYKRRSYSGGRCRIVKAEQFEGVHPVQETPTKAQIEAPSAQLLNIENEEEHASTSKNILAEQHATASLTGSSEENDEKRIIRYGKAGGDPHERKRLVVTALKESKQIYRAEPVRREALELVKFKKKRTPNSHVVPPTQKYMYAHEGVENFRYMTLSKQ